MAGNGPRERLVADLRYGSSPQPNGALAVAPTPILLRQAASQIEADGKRIETLETAIRTVATTFEGDIAKQYSTRDKLFAVEVLGKALNDRGDQPDSDPPIPTSATSGA